jgi:hypothetical protein
LRIFLEAAFGADAVYFDYDDRPADPSAPMNLDPDGFLKRLATNSFGFLSGKERYMGISIPVNIVISVRAFESRFCATRSTG